MSYKVTVVDNDNGAELFNSNVNLILFSMVDEDVHVEARCFSDCGERTPPCMAGALVAIEGLKQQLYSDISGLSDLVEECKDFCKAQEDHSNHPSD